MNALVHRLRERATGFGFDRLDLLLVVTFLVVAGSWVNEISSQPSARYLLTAAIVERQTVVLDEYEPGLGLDRIELGDHVYSDKAPLQPLLGVPVLAVAEAAGVAPASSMHDADEINDWARGNVGAWTQTFVFAVAPGAALLPLLRRHARRHVDDHTATVAAVATVCSTMILLFSVYLYAHVLVAFCAFLAWHVLTSTRGTPTGRVLLAGTVIGLAVAAEFQIAGAVAIFGLWVLVRHGLPRAIAFGLPTVAVGIGLLAWNRAVYGTVQTSYSSKPSQRATHEFLSPPKLYNTVEIFFGHKGFVFTPIVLVALAGLAVALYRRMDDVVVPAAMFGFVFALQAGWSNPWGGETANPRYMLLAIPFLAYPLAVARPWFTTMFFRLLVGLGVVSMGDGASWSGT